MKIKTITCHDVYNYGASLQAYALQQYLEMQGHDVQIIDYKPDYMRNHYKFWYVPSSSRYYARAMKNPVLRFMLCCYFAPNRFSTYGRKLKFDAFKKQYLHLTKRYLSYRALTDCPPDADVYIAGSDQIWNSNLPNGKDAAYFLQFGSDKTKRISYAASFAIPDVAEEFKALNSAWLRKFDAISVREHTGLSILQSLGINGGVEVLDPVYLLSASEWNEFAGEKPIITTPYILVYDLCLNDDSLRAEAERLSKEFALKIISVDGHFKCPYADKNISNAGPQEFVNMIAHAAYVVTNSFHATSFSLILNRPFSVFYKRKNISRMADILSHLNLLHCLNAKHPNYDFNWDDINAHLVEMSQNSINYLSENLK